MLRHFRYSLSRDQADSLRLLSRPVTTKGLFQPPVLSRFLSKTLDMATESAALSGVRHLPTTNRLTIEGSV